jgi:L-arabinokinase
MTTILYYVSSHGYGHAVRSALVIKELVKTKGVRVVVRTAAPGWLFGPTQDGSIIIDRADVDSGLVQSDSMSVDINASYISFRARVESLDQDAASEFEPIRRWKPSVIVSDISPLGVEAGVVASIPTVVVANFLWDWILLGYAETMPQFVPVAMRLREIYSKASLILQTKLSDGFDGYSNIEQIPLIVRKIGKSYEEARSDLGLSDGLKATDYLTLVSMGGMGLDRFFQNLEKRVSNSILLIPGQERSVNGRIIRFDRMKTDYYDLLAACDAVIGKMGYGLCSELIANKRPLLYTLRKDFREFKVLKEETAKYVGVVEVAEDDFFNGGLDEHIDALKKTIHPSLSTPVNGAEVAAAKILSMAK